MSGKRAGPVIACIVGIIVAVTVVFVSFPSMPVTISGVEVTVPGWNTSLGNVAVNPVFVAPTVRNGTIPSLPIEVSLGENLTVIWDVNFEANTVGTTVNVTLVSVSTPFLFTSTVPHLVWHDIRSLTPVLEEITVLAPNSPGDYDLSIVLSISS